ncbi:MAG: CRTAC1 family protein [Acidobacteriota bacterium]
MFAQGIAASNLPVVPKTKPSGLPFPVQFNDVAAEAGLTMRFVQGDPARKKYIVEANGTGVAFFDYDSDGLLDVYVVNGTRFTPAPGAPVPASHLYRNIGKGKFADVTARSGLGRSGWGNGVCRGDYNNDGHLDLYVTYWGLNSLYRNQGDGTFTNEAKRAGVASPASTSPSAPQWSTGCTFLDYDRDGHLDLFVASYAGFSPGTTPLPGSSPSCIFKEVPVFCGPRGLPHGRMTLYHNRGDGTFEDVSAKSGVASATGCYGFTAIAADLTADGYPDIYIACDSTPSLFFRNERNGTFRELGSETGLAFSEHGAEQAGMGLALADTDGDGLPDLTKTNFIRDYPNLYRNLGRGIFEDIAVRAGLAVNPHYVLWGTGLEDFDNDGRPDLFQVGGHVYPELEKKDPAEAYTNPRLVYRNLGPSPAGGARFEDVSALAGPAIAQRHASMGAAFGDFDNDGDIDVLIMNQNEPPSLLRNDYTGTNKWLAVQLTGTKSPRDATGALVTVQAAGLSQTSAVLSQSSYLSVNDHRLHFGLAAAPRADRITVRWPSGLTEEFGPQPSNQLVKLSEGQGTAKP